MTKLEELIEGVNVLIDSCYSMEGSVCNHLIFQRQKFVNELIPLLHSKGLVIKATLEDDSEFALEDFLLAEECMVQPIMKVEDV